MNKDVENRTIKKCPHCGSERLRKSGFLKSGYQQYYCRDCKKRVSALTEKKFHHTSEVGCPHCGSYYNKKLGRLKSGAARRICSNCGRSFSEKTVVKEKITEKCPKCNSSKLVRHGKNKDGEQKFKCKECNHVFRPKIVEYFEVECPKCHTKRATKSTTTGYLGQPCYRCSSCHHRFMEGGRLALTQKQKEDILKEYKKGVQLYTLGKKYDRTESALYRLVKNKCRLQTHIKNSLKIVPKQTQKDIIYFGLGARVSISDLSHYLKVDREVVKSILKSYADKYIKGGKDE